MTNPMATASVVERTEELRLALVMNGGVSLAVWIGGVSYEVNRFVGETHPVYRRLLELTRTHARVDVISGTSAGGVNGAALALASVYDKSLYKLRDIWLNRGAFADLLRRASQKDPPSLLDGDGYFLPLLKEAFRQLIRERPRDARMAPMDLSLPATLLRGEPSTRLDDLGELIEDATHRAHFRFSRGEQADPFAGPPQLADALAHAARASASFPVAFEPVLAQANEVFVGGGRGKARFAHYLVDGGVLDNKPIESALRAIFRMPAHGNVRRVLAYVVPDPSVSAMREDDKKDAPPMLAHVALSSLVSIPGAESIADQLDEIDAHNERVRHNRNLPAMLAATLTPLELRQLKSTLFEAYRVRRINGVLDYVLEEIEHYVGAKQPAPESQIAFGHRTRDWLKAVWRAMPESDQGPLWRDFIPSAANAWDFDLAQRHGFTWGQYAIEFVAAVVLDLLRRTQRLQHLVSARQDNVAAPLPVERDEDHARSQEGPMDWEALDQSVRDARWQRSDPAVALTSREADPMGALWVRVFALTAKLREVRASGSERLRENARTLLEALAAPRQREAQEEMARDWLRQQWQPSTSRDDAMRRNAEWAHELAAIVLDLRAFITPLTASDYDATGLRPEDQAARGDLARLYAYLYEPFEQEGPAPDVNEVMQRLLAFEVIQYAVARRPRDVDTFVELVQISARQASPFGGAATPEQKLAGMQLAHFGAFYRKSWRANDWMMGRLDGISRIVRIALNPDRLHRLYAGRSVQLNGSAMPARAYLLRAIEELAIEQADATHRALLARHWRELRDAVWEELSFLDSARARVPETLAASSEALTRRLHLEVLCREIPQLAAAVLDDVDAGAASSSQGTRLAGQVAFAAADAQSNFARRAARALRSIRSARLPVAAASSAAIAPEEAVRMFDSYRIGAETLADEMGADLMLRTGSHSLAIAHAAASGKQSGMKPIAPLLNLFRWPVRVFYLFANRLLQESRTSAGITTSMLVAGLLCVYASQAWDKAPTGVGVAGWALLFAWFVTAYLRRSWVFGLGIIALAAVLYLALGHDAAVGAVAALALVIVALKTPAWFGTPLIALAGAWWLTGKPAWADVASALCAAWGINACPVQGDAAAASGFITALGPLALVFAIALLAGLADRRRR